MRFRSDGYSLIWALVLTIALAMVGAALIQSAHAGNASARGVTSRTLDSISRRNNVTYAARLLQVNAAGIAAGIAVGTSATELPERWQAALAPLCNRTADGQARFWVFFSNTACGKALPGGLSVGQVRVATVGSEQEFTIPFLIVTELGGKVATKSGEVTVWRGTPKAGAFAVLGTSPLTLSSRLSVVGDIQSDSALVTSGAIDVSGTVGVSNCALVALGCRGAAQVQVGDVVVGAMGLTPSPGRALGPQAYLSVSQSPESPGFRVVGSAGGMVLVADTLRLGVAGDGGQTFDACLGGACTSFVVVSGNVYQDSAEGNLVAANWNGVLDVQGTAELALEPVEAGRPSVAQPLSVVTSLPVAILGDLTYRDTSCAGQICHTLNSGASLSVTAPSVSVSAQTARLHGVLITPSFSNAGPLSLYGSVVGGLLGGGELRIQADPQAARLGGAPLIPTLPNQWRKVRVDVE